jgi:hypothetical protein
LVIAQGVERVAASGAGTPAGLRFLKRLQGHDSSALGGSCTNPSCASVFLLREAILNSRNCAKWHSRWIGRASKLTKPQKSLKTGGRLFG